MVEFVNAKEEIASQSMLDLGIPKEFNFFPIV